MLIGTGEKASTPTRLQPSLIEEANGWLDKVCASGLALEEQPSHKGLQFRHLLSMNGLMGMFLTLDMPSRESGQREFYHSLRLGIYAAVERNPQVFAYADNLTEEVRRVCTAHDKQLRSDLASAKRQGVALTVYDEQKTQIDLTRGTLHYVSLCLGRADEMEIKQLQRLTELATQQGNLWQTRWEKLRERIETRVL